MNLHPYAVPFIVLAVVLAIILFAVFKGGGGETISKIWTHKTDKVITDERDEARRRAGAAQELSEALLGQLELFRLVLTTASVSIQRFNDWPATADVNKYRGDALVYLCDWTTRVFAFSKSDICKVTLWRPTGRGTLEVYYYNGMAPESADLLEFDIKPRDPNNDTFAAMSFRSGRPEVCHDVGIDERYHKLGKAPAHAYASIIAVPIRLAGATVGVLTIDSLFKENFKSSDQVQLAELCASLCGQFWDSPHPVAPGAA